jgi:GNAT superfamily N-acetyltransferase
MGAQRPGEGDVATIRPATEADLAAIVRLLQDDRLGAGRERAEDLRPYRDAFREIAADARHQILVLELNGAVAGVLQLSFLRCLTHRGGLRAQIEGVRVDARYRGAGLGGRLIGAAIARARAQGCHLVQLTTDRQRPDARRFYERLGFVDSHHGMKLELVDAELTGL